MKTKQPQTEQPSAASTHRAVPEPAETGWTGALLSHDGQLIHAARLAALGEIAAGIAHEMNQPLAAIQMIATSMLADIERGTLPMERARQWLGTINEQISRLSWIIGHLRSFSRNEAPELLAPSSIEEVAENALGLVSAQMRHHGISIELELEASLPSVRGDGRRLEQVFVNLLSNARDALDTLPSTSPKTVRIRAHALPERRLVAIDIADNGPGIPEKIREHIFEPFFTTKSAGKGTGLGLSIVHTIIAECGGRIIAESRPGAGTTFHIELPLAQPAHAEHRKEPTP